MNRSELIDRVAADARLPRSVVAGTIDATLAVIEAALQAGEEVSLAGFGRFHVGSYTGRSGVNPRTGERIEVPTTRVPRFAAGSRLRAAVR